MATYTVRQHVDGDHHRANRSFGRVSRLDSPVVLPRLLRVGLGTRPSLPVLLLLAWQSVPYRER